MAQHNENRSRESRESSGDPRTHNPSATGRGESTESDRRESEDSRASLRSGSEEKGSDESLSSSDTGLKSCEYRGDDGKIHHHTKNYMEQHQGESSGRRSGEESSRGEQEKHDSRHKAA